MHGGSRQFSQFLEKFFKRNPLSILYIYEYIIIHSWNFNLTNLHLSSSLSFSFSLSLLFFFFLTDQRLIQVFFFFVEKKEYQISYPLKSKDPLIPKELKVFLLCFWVDGFSLIGVWCDGGFVSTEDDPPSVLDKFLWWATEAPIIYYYLIDSFSLLSLFLSLSYFIFLNIFLLFFSSFYLSFFFSFFFLIFPFVRFKFSSPFLFFLFFFILQ